MKAMERELKRQQGRRGKEKKMQAEIREQEKKTNAMERELKRQEEEKERERKVWANRKYIC